MQIEGQRDVNPKLIFKILYEFIGLNGWLTHPILGPFLRSFVEIDNTKGDRIEISDRVRKHTISNTENFPQKHQDLERSPFKEYHYIVMRLSKEFKLYFEIGLFGYLRHLFIIGSWDKNLRDFMGSYDFCFIFPLNRKYRNQTEEEKNRIQYMWDHNPKHKLHYMWADVNVELRLEQIEQLNQE